MAEEKNSQDELAASLAGEISSVEEEDFSVKEKAEPKMDLDLEIEKNIKIRTMPRKFKISTAGGDKKTTIVGAVIMVVGFFVLAAAVYLAYIFLVNPQGKTPAPAANNKPEIPIVVPPAPLPPKPVVPVKPVTPEVPVKPATSTPVVVAPVATSTVPVVSNPIPPIATSTVAVKGAPTGAIAINVLSFAEKALFGADPVKEDSDGDGFSDISEVLGLYDPAGSGKITDNLHIGVYQNSVDKYSLDYPKTWKVQAMEKGNTVIFTAADNSIIEVISEANAGKQKIKDWYNTQFPDTPISDAAVFARDGWQGVFQPDKQTFYLADNAGNRLYTIAYVPAANNDLSYYNIFLMMINSLIVK